jgi:hypothetical protein
MTEQRQVLEDISLFLLVLDENLKGIIIEFIIR